MIYLACKSRIVKRAGAICGALLLIGGVSGPATATSRSSAPAVDGQITTAVSSSKVRQLHKQAVQLRRDFALLMDRYTTTFSTRLSDDEMNTMIRHRQEVQQSLDAVTAATMRLRDAANAGRPQTQMTVRKGAALSALRDSKRVIQLNWRDARDIAEPKLNFLERWNALNDYNEAMQRLDALDKSIRTLRP